jgi:hypothetical protein
MRCPKSAKRSRSAFRQMPVGRSNLVGKLGRRNACKRCSCEEPRCCLRKSDTSFPSVRRARMDTAQNSNFLHLYAESLVVTLAINCVLEYETLFLSIWGSPDSENWGTAPLASFSPKHYCGVYSILLNLAARPNIKYIRAGWRMQRWKSRAKEVMFDFSIAVEPSGSRIHPYVHESKRLIKAAG